MNGGVLQVVLSLAPGGTERLVIEIVKRLAPSFRFAVCCLDDPGAWSRELTDRGVPVVALHRRRGFRPSVGYRIGRLARACGARVLHCHQYSPFVYGRIAGWLDPRLAVIFTEHGRVSDAPPSRKRRVANRVFARRPAGVYAVSGELKDHLVLEGFEWEGVEVIPNGIELGQRACDADRLEARALAGVPHDAYAVGTAARLDSVKDLPTLIEGFARLRGSLARAVLVIVGDGPTRYALMAHARRLSVDDSVLFLGHRDDVRRLMPAFDVYVNSSISEGVSLTILEAMAAGLPVVATRVGGTPEVVVDGLTGLLVPPQDPLGLGAALLDLAQDGRRAQALGVQGRCRAERYYSIDRMVDAYACAYRHLPVA